MFFAGGANR